MTATTLASTVTMLKALQGAEGNLAGIQSHPDEVFAVEASGEEDLIEEEEDDDEEVPSPAKMPRVEMKRDVSDPGTFKPHRRGKKVSARKHRYEFIHCFVSKQFQNFFFGRCCNHALCLQESAFQAPGCAVQHHSIHHERPRRYDSVPRREVWRHWELGK